MFDIVFEMLWQMGELYYLFQNMGKIRTQKKWNFPSDFQTLLTN